MTESIKECVICLEELDDEPYFLPCWHKFHVKCIISWLSKNPICPICKMPFFIDSNEKLELFRQFTDDQKNDDQLIEEGFDMTIQGITIRFMEKYDIYNPFRDACGIDENENNQPLSPMLSNIRDSDNE